MYWGSYYVIPPKSNLKIKIPSCKALYVTAAANCKLTDLYHSINVIVQAGAIIKIPIVGVYSPATLIITNGSEADGYIHMFYTENGGIPDDEKYRELWGVE